MKNAYFLLITLGFSLHACTSVDESQNKGIDNSTSKIDSLNQEEEPAVTEETRTRFVETDLREVESLIRKVNIWHDLGNPYGPELILDSSKNIYTGINLSVLDIAAEDISSTGYFTQNFIKDYSDIYLTIDEKVRSGELIYEEGTYPPYGSGANPWCNCQDVPYDDPNPWEEIEIEPIALTQKTGQFYWKWANVDSDWGQHRYYFEVEKVDGKWNISHLEGFTHSAFFANK
ncbi:MAG: hypothetical protein P8P74_02685 [Crocinitomicaceae bacterium]|nr:hypothetical protein [Crocinitomicaceae bacterium]